ncbi:MAG: CHRD domain-containing protein, partial [bacterium]
VGVWNYLEAQEAMILQGRCYANIHTSSFGGGEIRGQIVPLNALLDGGQEVPANAATGSGWATATVDTAANSITYHIVYSGLTGAPTAAHFHGNRLHGASGGVKVGLTAGASPMTGTVSYLQADEGQLLSGMFYINLHTAAFPGGEIRGQLVPTVIPMDALQEVPAGAATGSSGFAMVAVDTAANALSYDVRLQALGSSETAAHIHGFAGAAATAGVQAGLTAGNRKLGTWTYGAANEVSVMSGLAYFNIHTSGNGGGEIRGQIERLPGAAAILDVVSGPRSFAGLTAAPNPFGRRTSVSFALARTGAVERTVVGVDGRVGRSFPSATFAPGTHSFDWDGLDDAGRDATPGVYFAVVGPPGRGAHHPRRPRPPPPPP